MKSSKLLCIGILCTNPHTCAKFIEAIGETANHFLNGGEEVRLLVTTGKNLRGNVYANAKTTQKAAKQFLQQFSLDSILDKNRSTIEVSTDMVDNSTVRIVFQKITKSREME